MKAEQCRRRASRFTDERGDEDGDAARRGHGTPPREAQQWPYTGAAALPRAYLDAVVRAGGQPVVVDPSGDLTPLLDRVDAIVLTGGPDVDPSLYDEERHAEVYGVDRAR